MPMLPRHLRPFVFALALLACLAPRAQAESLVQLTLHGEIDEIGGSFVQVEIDIWRDQKVVRNDIHLHVAQGTSAHDLASLVNGRLADAGAVVRFPGEGTGKPTEAHLFIEHTTAINLRLGHGMWGEVTTCEEAPQWIRFDEPQLVPGDATLVLTATTYHEHLKTPGRLTLKLPLDKDTNSAALSQKLSTVAGENGWVSERPTADRWSPLRSDLGAAVIGCNIRFESKTADWRLEVQLHVPGE